MTHVFWNITSAQQLMETKYKLIITFDKIYYTDL